MASALSVGSVADTQEERDKLCAGEDWQLRHTIEGVYTATACKLMSSGLKDDAMAPCAFSLAQSKIASLIFLSASSIVLPCV